jgi:hypothetical protein
MLSPVTPFREGRALHSSGGRPIYPCEEYWVEPKHKVMVATIQNGTKSIVHTLVDSSVHQPTTPTGADMFGTRATTRSYSPGNSHGNPPGKSHGNSHGSYRPGVSSTGSRSGGVYKVDSMANLNASYSHVSSDPRDINYWSEVSALRKRREVHTTKMNKILDSVQQKNHQRKSMKYQEAEVLKEVELLEAGARERMGGEEYSQLRIKMAVPRVERSIAELLIDGFDGGSAILESGGQKVGGSVIAGSRDHGQLLLRATKISEANSLRMLKKNERLRQRLHNMLK